MPLIEAAGAGVPGRCEELRPLVAAAAHLLDCVVQEKPSDPMPPMVGVDEEAREMSQLVDLRSSSLVEARVGEAHTPQDIRR
jgi:hypothetical protein